MLTCVGDNVSGEECASALSEASGVQCTYKVAVPVWIQSCFMTDLFNMVQFFTAKGYSGSIEEFKRVVPDAQNAKDFFVAKGRWANGEKFTPK